MRYTNRQLDALRLEGDPVPDALVASLAARGETEAVNALLRELVGNAQPVPGALPDDVEAWLRDSAVLPPGTDLDRLDRAAALFREHGLQMSFILSTASLVWCYAAVKGVRALTFSYRLAHNPYRRAAETSQFVLDVLAPGGLAPGGRGIRSAQKVRLMHAAIRHLIRRTGQWPEAELGAPICQEDQLLALLTFSSDVVAGLDVLGVPLSMDDAEDYLYGWRVIGGLLGIRPDLIPGSMPEAVQLKALIARRQYGPSEDGVRLTQALFELHDRLLPGDAFDGLVPALVRQMVGRRVADAVQVPRTRWDRVVRHYHLLGRYLEFIDRRTGTLGDLVDELAYRMLTRISISATDYERAGFDIPTELAEAWQVRRPGRRHPRTAAAAIPGSRHGERRASNRLTRSARLGRVRWPIRYAWGHADRHGPQTMDFVGPRSSIVSWTKPTPDWMSSGTAPGAPPHGVTPVANATAAHALTATVP